MAKKDENKVVDKKRIKVQHRSGGALPSKKVKPITSENGGDK